MLLKIVNYPYMGFVYIYFIIPVMEACGWGDFGVGRVIGCIFIVYLYMILISFTLVYVFILLYAFYQVCKYVIFRVLVNFGVCMNVFCYICRGIDLFVRFLGLGLPFEHNSTIIFIL